MKTGGQLSLGRRLGKPSLPGLRTQTHIPPVLEAEILRRVEFGNPGARTSREKNHLGRLPAYRLAASDACSTMAPMAWRAGWGADTGKRRWGDSVQAMHTASDEAPRQVRIERPGENYNQHSARATWSSTEAPDTVPVRRHMSSPGHAKQAEGYDFARPRLHAHSDVP